MAVVRRAECTRTGGPEGCLDPPQCASGRELQFRGEERHDPPQGLTGSVLLVVQLVVRYAF